jgi:hypothetical protein
VLLAVCVGAAVSIGIDTGRTTLSVAAPLQSQSPVALLRALKATAFPPTELPRGYTSVTIGSTGKLAGPSPGHTLLGVVGFSARGTGGEGLIYYAVYPSSTDARAIETKPTLDPTMRLLARSVPGFSQPGLTLSEPVSAKTAQGKAVTVTLTIASVAEDDVVAAAGTVDGPGMHAERALLRSALRHLQAVDRPSHN